MYRGYEAAVTASYPVKRPRSSSLPPKRKEDTEESGYQSDSVVGIAAEENREVKFVDSTDKRRKNSLRRMSLARLGNEDAEDSVTDLVLIIHGIGQGVR